MKLVCVVAEWEAVRTAEQAKDALSQQVSAEATAASNSQADTFNQQVAMMPVQVPEPEPQPNPAPPAGNGWPALSKLLPLPPSLSLPKLPVAQAVPSGVGLVPPAFPVSMGIPPPGYGPPPFIRPSFNASQPPPGTQLRWNNG